MRIDPIQNYLLRVLHLLVLGLASGWQEPQAFRVQAFVLMPVDATLNLDRFSQAMQDLQGNHVAAFMHAGPRSQLTKVSAELFLQRGARQACADTSVSGTERFDL